MDGPIHHYKLTISGPGDETEMRYLVFKSFSYHSYCFFKRKLMDTFPKLKHHPFTVNWKDKEGDIVRVCYDEEFLIALDEMKSDPLKKFFINLKPQEESHRHINCDSCNDVMRGFRYNCLSCADYDLCSLCERSQIHPDHLIVRIPKPLIPGTSYAEEFAKNIPIISANLERLFQLPVVDISQSSEQKISSAVCQPTEHKNSTDFSESNNQNSCTENKKKLMKFCHNDCHNLIGTLFIEKLVKNYVSQLRCQQDVDSIQSKPSVSTNGYDENEPDNVLTNALKSSSVTNCCEEEVTRIIPDENRRLNTKEFFDNEMCFQEIHPFKNMDEGLRYDFAKSDAGVFRTVIPFESYSRQTQITPKIDVAPTQVDPSPILQAQHTTPDPEEQARSVSIAFPDSPIPSPLEDDGTADTSWTVVKNERIYTSGSSSESIELIGSPEQSALSTPQQTDSPPAQEIDPYEESVKLLQTVGFEDKDWLKTVVEFKKGDIREVLKFLSPVPKPSA